MKFEIKIFFTGVILLLLTSLTIITAGCSCTPCQNQDESEIPQNILQKADRYIISKTGDTFFKQYITPDFSQSRHLNTNYLMVYRLYIPEKPFVDEIIRFTTDSLGKILTQYEVAGIPDCNSNPLNCDFIVDENAAKQIAIKNKLSEGIKDWKISFEWEPKYNKYVWQVINTLKESKGEFGYRAEGEKLLIDPGSSELIEKKEWKIN